MNFANFGHEERRDSKDRSKENEAMKDSKKTAVKNIKNKNVRKTTSCTSQGA